MLMARHTASLGHSEPAGIAPFWPVYDMVGTPMVVHWEGRNQFTTFSQFTT